MLRNLSENGGKRNAFTLIELLIVVAIISLVSAASLGLLQWSNERLLPSNVSIVKAVLTAAQDRARATHSVCGVRFLSDPAFPLSVLTNNQIDPSQPLIFNAMVDLATPPVYTDGLVSINPYSPSNPFPLPLPSAVLVLEECPIQSWEYDKNSSKYYPVPATPVNWWWNARIGDKIRIGNGNIYTVVGPMNQANPECCTNISNSLSDQNPVSNLMRRFVAPDGITDTILPCQYLYLVNGIDDNSDGYIDNGYDGLSDVGQGFETEQWQSSLVNGAQGITYSLHRRAANVSPLSKTTYLSSSIVIDASNCFTTRDKSWVNPNIYSGYIDILFDDKGKMISNQLYSAPSAVSLTGNWCILWLTDRANIGTGSLDCWLVGINGRTGEISDLQPSQSSKTDFHLQLIQFN